MMKSFFKKLAFVMALAMVVSLAAPAATTASAAEEMKIGYQNGAVITELNLTEARSSEDLKAVGAPSNWKELGITWISSNPAVATVDNAGVVTAVSAGTADIMVTCGDYAATITVNCFADAKSYDVTIGTADERSITEKTLKVNETFDFAFFGVKDYGRDKVNNAPRYFCEWDSTDTSVATVDNNGLVTAVAPGKAKITLIVWNLATGTKHNVTPTWVTVEAEKPAVDPNNFEVTKMISDSKFELTFENKDITKTELEAGLSAYYYVGTQRISYNYIKSIAVDNGVATVEFYSLVSDGVTYGFEYAGIEKETTVVIGEPTSMYIQWMDLGGTYHWCCAYAGYPTQLYAYILNENGADITASVLDSSQGKYIEFSLADTSVAAQYYMQSSDQIYFTAANTTASVVATFYNGYDSTGQRVKSVSSVPTAITSTTRPLRTFAYQDVYNASVNGYRVNGYYDNVTKLAVGDSGKYFAVSLVDNYGTWVNVENGYTTYDSEAGLGIYDGLTSLVSRYYGQFTFKSDNINIFTIDENTGYMVANKAGTANVLVYYDPNIYNDTTADKILVAIVPITTYSSRSAASFTLDSSYKTVSTVAGDGNYNVVTYYLNIKDQLGDNFNAAKALKVYTKTTAPTGLTNPTLDNEGVDIKATQYATGWYAITVTCNTNNVSTAGTSRPVYYGISYNGSEVLTFTANVVWPDLTLQASSYGLDTWTTYGTDVNPYSWPCYGDFDLTSALYVYKSGVKVAMEDVEPMTSTLWSNPSYATLDQVYVKVLKNGVDVTEKWIGDSDVTDAVTATGNALTVKVSATGILTSDGYSIVDNELGAGTYTILAYKAVSTYAGGNPTAMQLIASSTVTLTDSKMSASYVGKLYDTTNLTGDSQVNLNDIAKACFAVQIGDTTCRADWGTWGNVKVVANAVQYNANTTYFQTLEIYVPTDGIWGTSTDYVRYVVNVGDYVITQ